MERRDSRQHQEAEWVGLPAGLAVVNAERTGLGRRVRDLVRGREWGGGGGGKGSHSREQLCSSPPPPPLPRPSECCQHLGRASTEGGRGWLERDVLNDLRYTQNSSAGKTSTYYVSSHYQHFFLPGSSLF